MQAIEIRTEFRLGHGLIEHLCQNVPPRSHNRMAFVETQLLNHLWRIPRLIAQREVEAFIALPEIAVSKSGLYLRRIMTADEFGWLDTFNIRSTPARLAAQPIIVCENILALNVPRVVRTELL